MTKATKVTFYILFNFNKFKSKQSPVASGYHIVESTALANTILMTATSTSYLPSILFYPHPSG